MKKILHNSFWMIIKSCLILSTIVFNLILTSCSIPNSVRSGNQFFTSNSKVDNKKKEVVKDEKSTQLQEAERLFEKMSNNISNKNLNTEVDPNNEEFNTNPQRKIPSLREQMKIYTEQQDKMLDKLTFLERDIDNIKNDIEDIKVTIRSILANLNQKSATGIYGDENSKHKETKNEVYENNQSGFYLYPDEESEKSSNDLAENTSKQKRSEPKKSNLKENTKKNISISTEKPSNNKSNVEINKANNTQKTTNPQEFELAMDFLAKRDYQSAVAELTKLENNQKNSSEKLKTYYWLGESYFGLGNYSKAIDYFRKVVKSGDSYKKDYATIMIAESYLRIGRIEDAKKSYAKFVDEYPNSNQIPRAKKMLQQL
ncbi:MAG: tetratricopeptide repeat protein [Candidatus Kapabacteria bacterium]|nr:tetratricopeptide repeat protein [Candidatus Kapabacteria bacterium]